MLSKLVRNPRGGWFDTLPLALVGRSDRRSAGKRRGHGREVGRHGRAGAMTIHLRLVLWCRVRNSL